RPSFANCAGTSDSSLANQRVWWLPRRNNSAGTRPQVGKGNKLGGPWKRRASAEGGRRVVAALILREGRFYLVRVSRKGGASLIFRATAIFFRARQVPSECTARMR